MASLTDYAWAARAIGGDRVEVLPHDWERVGCPKDPAGRRGRVTMILDDGLVMVEMSDRKDGATLSFWPEELKKRPLRRA